MAPMSSGLSRPYRSVFLLPLVRSQISQIFFALCFWTEILIKRYEVEERDLVRLSVSTGVAVLSFPSTSAEAFL
ncbi:hypothetical protein V6N12_051567 [Hibiscus sabdariffa]|uniref:Uncharacterized protein n=1 Tax=Hibiscus sabdariffa TaxID=183260 RepID=A0ABR2GGC0_9ROSI